MPTAEPAPSVLFDPVISTAKAKLRTEARARRAALDRETRAAASLAVRDTLLTLLPRLALPSGAVVAGYRAMRDEIDPEPTLAALGAQGFRLALPAVVARAAPLVFRAWRLGETLEPDHLGIPAPPASAASLDPALILVPLLAFDRSGHRLGYGAGFYDRTLSLARRAGSVLALGLAFAAQEVDTVPADPSDARLDGVLTERAALWFTEAGAEAMRPA